VRRLLALAGLLLLTACGGSEATVCERGYWDGTVGTCVPEGWQVLDRAALDEKGMPPEVVVAFQSETPVSGQLVTVTVTREALTQPLSSVDYSEASIASVAGLPNYEEEDRQSTTVDGEDVDIHIFTAQPSPDQPESRFYQLSAVSGSVGYTFTAATPVTVPDEVEQQVLSLLQNVTFVQEGETTDTEE
jgi:hypothetical protein